VFRKYGESLPDLSVNSPNLRELLSRRKFMKSFLYCFIILTFYLKFCFNFQSQEREYLKIRNVQHLMHNITKAGFVNVEQFFIKTKGDFLLQRAESSSRFQWEEEGVF